MNKTHSTGVLVFACICVLVVGFLGGLLIGRHKTVDNPKDSPIPTASASATPFRTPTPSAMSEGSTNSVVHTVSLTTQGPVPKTLTINRGDSVIFVNKISAGFWLVSDPHPAHNQCPGFDSRRVLKSGENYRLVFANPGTCDYHNEANSVDSNQTGRVIVR